MLGRLQNIAGRQSCTGTEGSFNGAVSLLYLHLMETRRCRPTVPDVEKMSRRSELQSASRRERRQEETTLTCVNDFADVCWGQRKATFIVITEAALCWSHFRCIFFFFFPFTQELHVFLKACAHQMFANSHASMLT